MTNKEILKELLDLDSREEKDLQLYEEMSKLIKQIDKNELDDETKSIIRILKCNIAVGKKTLAIEAIPQDNYEELINQRGKLISLYKQREKALIKKEHKLDNRYKMLQEMKKHQEVLANYKKDKKVKKPVGKNFAITVKQIANSIKIFMQEKDVITKVKDFFKGTTIGLIGIAATSLLIAFAAHTLFGLPITLETIVASAPALAYVGLSGIVRALTTKTEFQQFQYYQTEEYKQLISQFEEDNKEALADIAKAVKERDSINENKKYEQLTANEGIIEKYQELIKKTKIDGLKEGFRFRIYETLLDSKELCNDLKEDYEEERSNDKERYDEINKKLAKINRQIFVIGNSLEQALKNTKESFIASTKIIVVTKAILSAIAPEVFFKDGIKSFAEPIIINAINHAIQFPLYPNKIKFRQTGYTGKVKSNYLSNITNTINVGAIVYEAAQPGVFIPVGII